MEQTLVTPSLDSNQVPCEKKKREGKERQWKQKNPRMYEVKQKKTFLRKQSLIVGLYKEARLLGN